ncbi:hypothetical protein TrST_g6439 [Triparma strigata]|uniref:Tyrosine-protein kinase ephrin type A/B receptor-like domain-containing protein n=1 Tax=Triparma strigata TaxID=1606541 RepID=A0A9W6ZT36_9STRA|nr:hypothetical protein TrST_g6439 [Triparma strigata]
MFKYSGVASASVCSTCPGATYAPTPGHSSCLPCAEGTWATTDHVACTSSLTCPLGEGVVAVGGACEICPTGKYSDLDDNSQCTVCAAGKSNSKTASSDSSACVDCDAGKYASSEGASSEGASSEGASTCTSCVAGKI